MLIPYGSSYYLRKIDVLLESEVEYSAKWSAWWHLQCAKSCVFSTDFDKRKVFCIGYCILNMGSLQFPQLFMHLKDPWQTDRCTQAHRWWRIYVDWARVKDCMQSSDLVHNFDWLRMRVEGTRSIDEALLKGMCFVPYRKRGFVSTVSTNGDEWKKPFIFQTQFRHRRISETIVALHCACVLPYAIAYVKDRAHCSVNTKSSDRLAVPPNETSPVIPWLLSLILWVDTDIWIEIKSKVVRHIGASETYRCSGPFRLLIRSPDRACRTPAEHDDF